MAVTHQFARVSEQQLASCRAPVEELDRLCSFATAPRSDYLDLDWAPGPLLRVGELACADPGVLAALRRALTGDEEVNPAYRDHPATVWEHPVTTLTSAAVAQVAQMLPDAEAAILAALSSPGGETLAVAGELLPGVDRPGEYLTRHLAALLDFYAGAAHHELAVVVWWD
ncbi:hypothetical protein [Planobispora takensis]|uniref:DUF1877 domain-containing protein n=1 Tax=Planobispora takensis TaxID=1367882 RepID=A0A8J3T1Y4_9ACTN|nr:hypothetical protein [Planobispora takensis]GIH99583.1 hypothetical protein Pta02_15920 [Planobispora takensis]